MKYFIIFIVLIISISSFGQNKKDDTASKDEYRNEGYFNITKLSYITTNSLKRDISIPGEGGFFSEPDASNAYAWSFQTINGYFISPQFSLGVGVGLDGHNNPNFNTFPVFLDARVYLEDEANTFYTCLDIGPTIRFGGEAETLRKGVLFNIGLGYKFKVQNRLFLVSDIFYSHKTVSLTDEGIGVSDDTVKSNGVGISLGVIF